MHQDVEVNLPYARYGKLYLENGERVLHLFLDLTADDFEALAELRKPLERLIGPRDRFDKGVIHLSDCSSRSPDHLLHSVEN